MTKVYTLGSYIYMYVIDPDDGRTRLFRQFIGESKWEEV